MNKNSFLGTIYTIVCFLFWSMVFGVVALATTLALSFLLPIGASFIVGLIAGSIVTFMMFKKHYDAWIISPESQQVWYTVCQITGTTRFYTQGLNFKLPFETRVVHDIHEGVIHLNRVLSEEDDEDVVYTCIPDNGVIGFDWIFTFWANVIDQTSGKLIYENCMAFIKTDMKTKQTELRALLESYLTYVTTKVSSEDLRRQLDDLSTVVEEQIFLPSHDLCETEVAHGVMVGEPKLKGILDSPEIKAIRATVQRSFLLQDVARNLGKPFNNDPAVMMYEVDEEVLVAANIIKKEIKEIRTTPGTRQVVVS